MLQSISIVNFALIDDIQSDFGRQLNVVTGETGSGKSIVMDALSLVLGARADLSAVRDASKKCIVEAVFDLSKSTLKHVFDDLEVDLVGMAQDKDSRLTFDIKWNLFPFNSNNFCIILKHF